MPVAVSPRHARRSRHRNLTGFLVALLLLLIPCSVESTCRRPTSAQSAALTRRKRRIRRQEKESFSSLIDDPSLSVRGGGGRVSKTAAAVRKTAITKIAQPRQAIQKLFKTPPADDPHTLMLIRLLFFSYYGSLGSLMPYLPVYYDSLGHGGQIIGLLGAVIVAPAWGMLADQSGRPFLILQVTFLVSLAGQVLVGVPTNPWLIMNMVFWTALFNAPVKSLLDGMVLDQLQDKNSYGRLRLWGQLGFGVCSSVVGMMLSKSQQRLASQVGTVVVPPEWTKQIPWEGLQSVTTWVHTLWHKITGYKLLFFTHAALAIPTWLCIQAFQRLGRPQPNKKALTEKRKKKSSSPPPSVLKGIGLLLHDADALLFFLLVLIVGVSSGVIENFAYVRMREVGGTGKEMGLSRLVSSLAGAPMFWFSGRLTASLGVDRIMVLALLSYVTRFFLYAAMQNPYHGLPAEALRGVTFAAFWSTGTIYAHRVSPPGMASTMLILLNAMYGGLGQSLGAVLGGKLQHSVGTVRTFVYAGLADLAIVSLVVVYLKLWPSSNFRDPQPIVPKRKR